MGAEEPRFSPRSLAILGAASKLAAGVNIHYVYNLLYISDGLTHSVKVQGWPADDVIGEWTEKMMEKARNSQSQPLYYWESVAEVLSAAMEQYPDGGTDDQSSA